MKYHEHQRLIWQPARTHEQKEYATVVGLRERGRSAKLSNGWVVDSDGIAEGTDRQPGGSVREPTVHEVSPFDAWYLDCMQYAIAGQIAPGEYKWSFQNADTAWRAKFDAGMTFDAAVHATFMAH